MNGWGADLRRCAVLLAVSSSLGLLTNALSRHPVALLSETGPGSWPQKAPRITIDQLRTELTAGRTLLIIDVRSEAAFRAAHPSSAINAPAAVFLSAYRDLGLSRILQAADGVVVMCDSAECPSGDRVARLLNDFGHAGVRVLQEGWRAYERSNLARSVP